jgi:hypothetical protein
MLVFTTATTIGCKKGGAEGSGSAGCTAEHTKIDEFGICIKVPKAWTVDSKTPTEVVWFRKGEGGSFSITFNPEATPYADMEDAIGKGPGTQKGELFGGKSKWAYRSSGTSAIFKVSVQSAKGLVSCSESGSEAGVKSTFEICKSITPM